MKIESIQIENFRSIQNATITMHQVLAIVGQNNVGKSHILRALNAFFNFDEEKRDFDNLDMNGLAFLKSCFFYQRPVHSFITILF